MNLLDKYTPQRLLLISVVSAIFIIYPNLSCLPWELSFLDESDYGTFFLLFFFRYGFFSVLIWSLIRFNQQRIETSSFQKRFLYNFLFTGIAYLIYVSISFLTGRKTDCFTSILLFQFFIVCIFTTFIGHLSLLYSLQRKKDMEIEQLKVENLQSRCDALANQINPHFFFNSLNGLNGLIRKKDEEKTIEYVNKLSDVFRYILQSDKKGLVTLEEELTFVEAFRYMMEVRFANKLSFQIDVPDEYMKLKIPVLSLLPLIDNIVVHNTIDSQHKMMVSIYLNEKMELVISNPIFPKLIPPATNGTGIKNVENRFSLLMNKQIKIENNDQIYKVYLPLK